MRHGAEPALPQRQARLGAIQGQDLGLLVVEQNDDGRQRINVEADDVARLGTNLGSFDSFNCRTQ